MVFKEKVFCYTSELRAWLLFYSLPCLEGCIDEMRLKHFSLFVEAAYILLTEGITISDLQRADMLLTTFMKHVCNVYYGSKHA